MSATTHPLSPNPRPDGRTPTFFFLGRPAPLWRAALMARPRPGHTP